MADVMSLASRVIRELASHLMKDAFADKPLLGSSGTARLGCPVHAINPRLHHEAFAEGFFRLPVRAGEHPVFRRNMRISELRWIDHDDPLRSTQRNGMTGCIGPGLLPLRRAVGGLSRPLA
jgi:hypothetical protein